MKLLVEKNIIDEDFKKETYQNPNYTEESFKEGLQSKQDQVFAESKGAVSFGFKKRETKKNEKKRKAEVSDGESD